MTTPIHNAHNAIIQLLDEAVNAHDWIRDTDNVDFDLDAGNIDINTVEMSVTYHRRRNTAVEVHSIEIAPIDVHDLVLDVADGYAVIPIAYLEQIKRLLEDLTAALDARPLSAKLNDLAHAALELEQAHDDLKQRHQQLLASHHDVAAS